MLSKYKYLFIGLIAAFILVVCYVLIMHMSDSGVSISNSQNYPYSSCYSHYNGKVYYNKPFRGYFEVPGADTATFTPLSAVSDPGTEGKDKNHVYFKTVPIPGLVPAETVYIGWNYCKNARQVLYGTVSLNEADVSSFMHFTGYYASDKNHVYYKQYLINAADPASLGKISDDKDTGNYAYYTSYLKDKSRVYYKGAVIINALPAHFICLKMNDGPTGMEYAFDGRHYFYQDHEVLVDNDEAKSEGLKLLSTDIGFTRFALFYKEQDLYAYDYSSKKLIYLGARDNGTPLVKVDTGVFKDNKHLYFAFYESHYGKKETGIAAVQGVNPADFKSVTQFTVNGDEKGTIYQSANQKYFHRLSPGDNHAEGLSLFEADGTVEDLPLDKAIATKIDDGDASEGSWKSITSIFKRDTDYNDN